MSRRPRVVIADDHPAVLIALGRILEPQVDVVALAHDGDDLLQHVGNQFPDVVVTDILMPKLNGLDACCHIRRMYPTVLVVIVSNLLDDDTTTLAFESGASAVVHKTRMVKELPAAVLALFNSVTAA
jgi:DNA-binding NarL/FixJ family response regulator